MTRELVEQMCAPLLNLGANQGVVFSLLPEQVVFYVGTAKSEEERLVCTIL